MKNTFKLIFCSALILVAPAAFAAQFGLVYDSTTTMPSNTALTGKTNFAGGGAYLEFGGQKLGLELGGFYTNKMFSDATFAGGAPVQLSEIQALAMVRYHLSHVVSLGVGGYGGFGLNTTNANTGATVNYAMKNNDYGLSGSLAFNFPMSRGIALHIEGLYNYCLTNLSLNTTSSLYLNSVSGLVGLTFGGGGSRY